MRPYSRGRIRFAAQLRVYAAREVSHPNTDHNGVGVCVAPLAHRCTGMWKNGRTSDCCLSRCFQLPVWRPSRISRQTTLIRNSICQYRLLPHKHQMNYLKLIWLISSGVLVISEMKDKMRNNEMTKVRADTQARRDRTVLRGSPCRGESLLNFCERISFENGYESPFWFLDKPSGSIDEFFEDRNIKRIAYVSGCSHEDLVMCSYKTYHADGFGVRFFAEQYIENT